VLLLGGVIAAAWMAMSGVSAGRGGAGSILFMALAVAGGAMWTGAHHSLFLVSAIFGLLGWMLWTGVGEDARAVTRAGAATALALLIGVGGIYLLNRPMWEAHEPNDKRFWYCLYNTVFLMLGIPFAVAGSLGLAVLLNDTLPIKPGRGWIAGGLCVVTGAIMALALWATGARDFALVAAVLWLIAALGFTFNLVAFRTIFYLPSFTSGVALMILWKALYNPQTGPINAILGSLTGLPASELPQWLASIELAKPSLMIMGFWTAIGGTNMLLYLAALSNVPVELGEAAEIDGATRWQRFVHVTWPQLAPTTFFISIVSIIGGLQGGFEQARVMTGGGPAGATTTLSYYIYTVCFQDLNFGYAAAISWVLFAMLFCITAFNWRFGKSLDV
jgi:multiple sugar transport system permease protein